ncbi:DUF6371 domain-containing protein [Runella slithyformis]|uniref:Uncharacterized protein n=1 Tax=Runella slithyformis (strain ATCC 29530 / DSM 19594 / LMG 11500 / NCIMB 11436 / LSU 4) TaxID=761193 RepID=A0A7U3ZPX7_RUNSL|nr:DUF6371 domain-containing protein [Runella slithyformis]AEI51205.1 hypothetical protein Runsl_4895 [Runella slithyformis DSM 19594]
MSEYRYQFKRYKSPSDRVTCPSCDHKRTFTPYIDTVTGELLPTEYGKCERRNNCGYELNPYQDGYAKMIWQQERGERPTDWKPKPIVRQPTPPPPKPVFIPNEVMQASLKAYHQNNFVKYLQTVFDASDVEQVTAHYQIGTSNRWEGSTVFWYIDLNANVRAGQVKCFDETGHTIKDVLADGETKSRTTWVHSLLQRKQPAPVWLTDYLNQENKVGCLFGEHLLKSEPAKVVCVVEAPKTAMIASLYFPNFIWLAVGALTYLTADRCKALEGRKVILWPDLNGYNLWKERADKLSAGRWKVSDFLEQVATDEERKSGLDLADYLPRFHYKDFQLGFPHQWNDPAPMGYVPKLAEHTAQSLELSAETIGPPMTENDLIKLWSG